MLKSLSTKDFEQFLDTLDRNREQAGVKYLALRERLENFFGWRDCENAEELTDTVFDRVAQKIVDGEEIRNTEAYCVSAAKFVLMENRRAVLQNKELDENSPEIASNPHRRFSDSEDESKDKQLKCLDKCLKKFPEDKQKILMEYFNTDEKTMIDIRKRLAKKMGINLNSLRIRISRLKSKLEKCTKECCAET